jgi:hypothetical protein
MTTLWGAGATILSKGSETISVVGSKVQKKLDDTGVSSNVSYYVSAAAEGTVNIGSKIYNTSAEKIEQIQ